MRIFVLSVSFIFLLSCGGNSGGNGNPSNGPRTNTNVDLNSIPEGADLHMASENFSLKGVRAIEIDLFGFDDNFEIKYVDVPDSRHFSGEVITYAAEKNSSTTVRQVASSRELAQDQSIFSLKARGNYNCSIDIRNRTIRSLEGYCYLKIEVRLPKGARVEVYNVGELKTKRFFAMSFESLLAELDQMSFGRNKFVVVKKFHRSYKETGIKLSLKSEELSEVLNSFTQGDYKLDVLRLLHSSVLDRENFEKVIKDNFSYFDQEEARKIVGLI